MTQFPGRLWPIDPHGHILNDARPEFIRPPFAAAVQDALQAYIDHIEADLDSLYITGSVARGLAVEGQSDLNVLAVLASNVDPELVLRDWIPKAEAALQARHPSVSEVQLELWPYFNVFNDPARFSIGGFILKTHSACLWGGDLGSQLPDYRISPAIANDDLVEIALDIEDAADAIHEDPDPLNVQAWSRYAAKGILRSAFELVQVQAGVHTRDVDLCCDYALRYFPARADDLRLALRYAAQPTASPAEALHFLEHTGGWLIAQAESWLDRHNPDREPALPVDDVEEGE